MKCRTMALSLALTLITLFLYSGKVISGCPPIGKGSPYAVGAADPNSLTGPGGYGEKNYIPYGSILPYRIDFENDAAATAPAQQVDVTNDLDPNLDWSTFELTDIGFGDTFIAVPPGSKKFETTVVMTYQGVTFDVEIKAGIDETKGQAYAHFYTIDPLTGLPPSVEIGFLPPEDGTRRGMGYVSYIINHDEGLAENIEIRNIALIVFDMGEQIYTNQVDPHDPGKGTDPAKEALVTLDENRPVSSVLALPEEAESSMFTVHWAGSDTASGIAYYDIYTRTSQDITWQLWQEKTAGTSAQFIGTPGQTHEFYSVAMDNVGFREDKFPKPDTKTYINPAVVVDTDADGIGDDNDNCQTVANTDQADQDNDGLGDACDTCPLDGDNDADADGICGNIDNCPALANSNQANNDNDAMGDLCDFDDDNDGVDDPADNCPLIANTDQADQDADGLGDVCDEDDDNDGVIDTEDNCPVDANEGQEDNDSDSKGDVCDPDDDNDTIVDTDDNCPLVANVGQDDFENDGLGDACDEDDDNDTVADADDNCPFAANTDQADNDADGPGDACDPDDDNDSIIDALDNCPFAVNLDQENLDGDGQGDVCDEDDDNDAVPDEHDNCPRLANQEQTDQDGDSQGDVCDICPQDPDNDSDNDGVCGDVDNCPNLSNPDQFDLDRDTIGDLCDPQTCGNRVLERSDEFTEICDDGNILSGDGCSDQCITETVVSLGKAEVNWKKGEIRFQGNIALPIGLYPGAIVPQAQYIIQLGEMEAITGQVSFAAKDNNGMRWEYPAKGVKEGAAEFTINWQQAIFDYRGLIHVKANHIDRANPTLNIDREGLTGEFTVQLGSVTVMMSADNSVSVAPEDVPVVTDGSGKVEVTLPFSLVPDMRMTISRPGQADSRIVIGDYMSGSEGMFDLQAAFNPKEMTGLDVPALLNLRILLGQVGYPGSWQIDTGWKFVTADIWRFGPENNGVGQEKEKTAPESNEAAQESSAAATESPKAAGRGKK